VGVQLDGRESESLPEKALPIYLNSRDAEQERDNYLNQVMHERNSRNQAKE
jgi:hypothetical protein